MRSLHLGSTAFWTTVILLSSGAGALGLDGTPAWSQSQVSDAVAGYQFSSPVLAFDHYGTASISWSSVSQYEEDNTVYYSQLLGMGLWTHRVVASGNSVGLRTGLSFDRAERPTVAWLNETGAVYAEFNGGGAQEVVSSGANIQRPVLTLSHDLAGDLRGMFGSDTAGEFLYLDYAAGSFSSGPLTTIAGIDTVMDAAMTTDHRGLRHICARAEMSAGGQAVVIASEPPSGGAWPSSEFVTASEVNGVDIAVDPTDGRMALAYTTSDGGISELCYAKFNGVSMETTPILSSPDDSFEDVSLAFDFADGRPAIAFECGVASSPDEMRFAYLDEVSEWQVSLVDGSISLDTPGGMPRGPSLAFDDYGTSWPAIAYVDDDGSLMAAFDPPVPEPGAAGLLCVGVGVLVGRRRSVRHRS